MRDLPGRGLLRSSYLFTSDGAIVDHGRLDGFYLTELGEGLVVADKTQAGLELLKARRMVRGPAIVWRPGKNFARIGGNLG